MNRPPVLHHQILRDRLLILRPADQLGLERPLQHVVALFNAGMAIPPRRKVARTFQQPRQSRRLREIQIVGALPKVTARGRLRAVESRAEENAVEIKLEDLTLAAALL